MSSEMGHESDCAVCDAPAYPGGVCTCGAVDREIGSPWSEAMQMRMWAIGQAVEMGSGPASVVDVARDIENYVRGMAEIGKVRTQDDQA